jgi:hypothetical protein
MTRFGRIIYFFFLVVGLEVRGFAALFFGVAPEARVFVVLFAALFFAPVLATFWIAFACFICSAAILFAAARAALSLVESPVITLASANVRASASARQRFSSSDMLATC